MGRSDNGSICPVHCQRRISVGATKPSTLSHRSHSNELVSRHRALSVSASGNNDPVGQESDRGIRSTVALPRILQPNIFGSQDRRVLQTGIRLEILEPLCPKGEVQNDHSQNSNKCDAQGGLGREYRPERRVLSCPYSRPVQTSAAVRRSNKRRAPSFSIQSPPVRSDLCPTGVYQGNSSGGAPCASTRCLPSSVPRRLATKKSKQVAVGSANKLVARHHSSCGVCAKRAQVTISSHSTSDTHRCRISSRPRSDVPTDEPCSKVRRQDRNTAISVGHDILFSAVPPRTVELSDRCNSTRQVASQTSATIFADPLVSGVEKSQGTDPSEARLVGPSSPMVVGQEVHQSWNVAGHSRSSGAPIHRRVGVGLGSPSGRSPDEWELVDEGGHSTHQSLGNVGGPLRPTGLPSTADRSYGAADVRQFLSCFVHTKTGGDSVCVSVPSYSRGTAPGAGRTDHSSSQTHSRRSECSGRPAVQNEQNSAHGMDPSPVSVQSTMHHMGHTQSGPVRNPPQQQASGVCVPHGRPTSGGCRCHVDVMEGNVRLRIPPICDAGASTGESAQGSSLRDDSSRPEMAQSVLVRQTVGPTSRLSFGPATEGRSTVPAPQPPETPVSPGGVPTRLEAVKRSLTERGFSQTAAYQISRGRRQSSRAVYDSKWRIFSGWCAGQSVDPFQVTIPQLADFFVFLFQVKHLNPRTIKGYRSAISSTISACGSRTELSYSQELSSLIRSFQLERPLQRKVAPQWNLSLVLQALTKPPFEPIAKCELKYLTLKTVFLVALASGRRRSEPHALCFDSHHFRQNQDQSMVTLYPDLEFVAKTQALDAVAEPIKLRAFTSVGSADIDRKLCPVSSLLQYRKATTTPECRKGRKKLFISYKPSKSDEIKRATISTWIVKLIRLAYESEGSDPRTLELHKVSAHEVRALSASASVFRGMTLDTVLQSCTWRSRNTFSDFYLRDMCSFLDDIFVMSSSVAGT